MAHLPTRPRSRALAALTVGLLVLGACGSSGGDDATDGNDRADVTTTAPNAGSAAEPGEEPSVPADDSQLGAPMAMTFGDELFVADLTDPAAFDARSTPGVEVGGGSVVIQLESSDVAMLAAVDGSSFGDDALHVSTLADTVNVDAPVNGTWGVRCRGGVERGGYIGSITQAKSDPNSYNWSIAKVDEGGAKLLAGGGDDAWLTNEGGSIRIGLSCNATSKGQVLDLLVGEDWVGQATDPAPLVGAGTGLYTQTSGASGGTFRFSDLRVFELVPA